LDAATPLPLGRAAFTHIGLPPAAQKGGGLAMLWTIFVILLVMWLLGMVSSYTLGGFIHILLVIALVALVLQLVSGRRAL
jgi:hypothetical protein